MWGTIMIKETSLLKINDICIIILEQLLIYLSILCTKTNRGKKKVIPIFFCKIVSTSIILIKTEEGKHSMSQAPGKVWNRALLREGCLASWASRDEAFWQSHANFRPPNPAADEKAYGVRGSVYVVTLSAFKKCLEERP